MRLLFSATLSVLCASTALAQAVRQDSVRDDRTFSFYTRGPYRSSIPRPERLLGFELGDQNTQYAAQERTLLAIANAAKDRVRVEVFGESVEGRTMRIFLVSAPENIARLSAIRGDLAKLADPRNVPKDELDAIVTRTPAVVWLNHSVHGNESSGFETAMQTLYQLAASQEPATLQVLKNTLVVINPSTNPDGHERFAVWYNSVSVEHPDPGANEHDEPWSVQGRFNHYRFDMNRDVMTTTQHEAQGIVRTMLRWPPMVAADLHGHTEQFFFPPVARAINEHVGPRFERWLELLGRGNAAAFDRHGWLYYSRDIFDFYGVFYWDTWPSLTGGIGMTFETDGGGWKGILWRREDGSLLSFRDGIAKHYVATMATLESTAAYRSARVRDYLRFRQEAVEAGRTERMKRIVFLPEPDPRRAAELATTLLRSGIEVRRAQAPFSSERAHAYADDSVGARRFEAGAYVVDLAQPQGTMARAFLEPRHSWDSVFVRAQLERFRRNQRRGKSGVPESYEFYDVTAWSLPVAFGVQTYWTEDAPPVKGELLTAPGAESSVAQVQVRAGNGPQRVTHQPASAPQRACRQGRCVEPIAIDVSGGIVTRGRPQSAYVFAPDRNGASRLAYHLVADGYRVAVASRPIEAAQRQWPRGTYVVRVTRNDSTLHARIDSLARESGVEVVGVNSAYTDEGQYGIGSETTISLTAPKIAMLGDEGISQTSYGTLWWSFERRYGIKFMPISFTYLTDGDLSKFNALVIPDASPSALSARLDKDDVERLRNWVKNGGTLITMGGSTAWAATESVNLTSARKVGPPEDTDTSAAPKRSPARDTVTEERRRRPEVPDKAQETLIPVRSPSADDRTPASIPGSHFDVELDRTHWLTFGYERPRVTVLLEGNTFLKLSEQGANVGVFPNSGTLHRSGFIWPDNTERLLRGTAYLIEESTGDGHVVLFVNEPLFRGWWRALDRLLLNAMLMGPTF